jgi:cell division septal protein FtsQ
MEDDWVSDDVRAELDEVFAETDALTRPSRRIVLGDDSSDSSAESGGKSDTESRGDSTGPRRPSLLARRVRGLLRRDDSDETDETDETRAKSPAKTPAKPAASRTATTQSSAKSSAASSGSSSGKKRVVISDDDSGPVPAAAPAGASRFRQRRIAIRRAAGLRRLRWFSVVGITVAAVLVFLLLLTSPILSIRNVEVEGNVYADPTTLGEVISDLKGEPILTADLHGAETRLESIPWVREASLSTHLPSRVLIQIVERRPIAFYRAVDGFNRVIDRDGRVLDVIQGDPVDYFPIRGTGPNLSAGDTVGQPFLGAAQLINALPADLQARLIAMAVSADGDVSMSLTDEVEVLFGRPNDFQTKLVGVVNEIKKQGSNKYAIIDVSSGEPSVR